MGICEVAIELENGNGYYRTANSIEDVRLILDAYVVDGHTIASVEFAQLMWPVDSNAEIEIGHGWWCVDNQTRFEHR